MPPFVRTKFCRENFFLAFLLGLFLFVLFVMLLFDFQYSEKFAICELHNRDFEQVIVLHKYTIGRGGGMASLPVENWFYFSALGEGVAVTGRLICFRQVWDIRKSRCVIKVDS